MAYRTEFSDQNVALFEKNENILKEKSADTRGWGESVVAPDPSIQRTTFLHFDLQTIIINFNSTKKNALTCVTRCSNRSLDGLMSLSLYSTLPICGSGAIRTASSSSGHTSPLAGGLVPGSNRSKNESMMSFRILYCVPVTIRFTEQRSLAHHSRRVVAQRKTAATPKTFPRELLK